MTPPDADGPPQPDDALVLPDYEPGGQVALDDEARWPGLGADGARRLRRLAEHPDAPSWLHRTGHRLTPQEQARAAQEAASDPGDWLPGHLARARGLPAHRHHPGPLVEVDDFPFVTREDLVADVAAHVPYDAPLERVLHGTSSGSTGAALVVPDDPDELARGFHWLVGVVARARGDDAWHPDAGRAGLLHVVHQHQAFTYTSVLPHFGESVMARVNLDLRHWPDRASRARFLAAADPQVVSGPPAALETLLDAEVAGAVRPLALVSGATELAEPLRTALGERFGVPVVDVYGLHETRPVAVSIDGAPFRPVARRCLVEVLDDAGAPVAPGEVGEIVVTAGENAFLPLVRYRTGDTARLVVDDDGPGLVDLQGRAHVWFRTGGGARRPAVDLTQHLQAAGARGWSVLQGEDDVVLATIAGGEASRARAALEQLLGVPVEVRRVERIVDLGPGKPRRFEAHAPRE